MSVQVNVHGGNGEKSYPRSEEKMQRACFSFNEDVSFYEPPSVKGCKNKKQRDVLEKQQKKKIRILVLFEKEYIELK